MTATMDSSRDTDRAECISEGHLQFMREYIRREEETGKGTLDRFLAGRLLQRGKYAEPPQRGCTGIVRGCSGILAHGSGSIQVRIPLANHLRDSLIPRYLWI